jgi:spore germination protein YaaH
MRAIALLFLIPAFCQNWNSFHSQELDRFQNIQVNYKDVDSRAKDIDLNRINRSSLTHEVIGYLPYWEYSEYPDLDYSLLTQINFFSAELSIYGDIVNDHNWENLYFIDFAQSHGVKVKLCATLFGSYELSTLLENYFYRQNAINNLLDLVLSVGADGIDIDFELLPTNQRDNLVLFMEELSFAFHSQMDDPIITMATPAIDWSNAWDYESLAEITDGLFIMGYNYFYSGSANAGPVAPLGGYFYDIEYTVNDYLNKTNNQTDKLILGLPYYGYDWDVVDSSINSETMSYGIAKTYAEARMLDEYYGSYWDQSSNSAWLTYYDDTWTWNQCWFDDHLSLSNKYAFAKEFELQGIGIWALGYDDDYDDLWNLLKLHFESNVSGDINLDESTDIQDIIIVINIIIGNLEFLYQADLNNDQYIDVLDILILVNLILDR